MLSEPANLNHARTLDASRIYHHPHVSRVFVNVRTTVHYNSLTKSPAICVNDTCLDTGASQLTAMY